MAVRVFDGTDDELTCLPGATVGMDFGPATTVALIKRNSTNSVGFIIAANAPNNFTFALHYYMWVDTTTNLGRTNNNGTPDLASPAIPWLNADGWVLIAMTKADGTVTPRFHHYNLGTTTITRSDGASTQADSTTMASTGRWKFGRDEHSNVWGGKLAVTAVWNGALSDAQVDELYANLRTSDWLTNSAGAPLALWEFNQTSVATPVPDATGGGATQSAIVGTSVDTGDDPPGWTFLPVPAVIPPRFVAIPFMGGH